MLLIIFGSSSWICIYGNLSHSAEHQAFEPSKRAKWGELSVFFEDDAVILSFAIRLLCIPSSSLQLSAKKVDE